MIYEVANIQIKSGMGQQFEQSFLQALPLFKRAAVARARALSGQSKIIIGI
jgi:hypothetical protein